MNTSEIIKRHEVPAMAAGEYHSDQSGLAGRLNPQYQTWSRTANERDLRLVRLAKTEGTALASCSHADTHDNGRILINEQTTTIYTVKDLVVVSQSTWRLERDGHQHYVHVGAWLVADQWQLGLAIWLKLNSYDEVRDKALDKLHIIDPLRPQSAMTW